VYVNNGGGTFAGRAFSPGGVAPRVAVSGASRFISFQGAHEHPVLALYRGGAWTVRDLTPTAGPQRLLAVTAARGLGTVLAVSEGTDRLYAVANP
jgi:hypothetical protein